MTGFFIRHPLPAIVAALLLTIFGLLAAFSLPIAQYPEIAPPTVMVSTTYIGADAEVLNDTVAQVIENEVNGVEGIDYMKSTSDSSGAYYLEIIFRPEIDGDTAAVKVQNRISSALPQLPDEVQSYGVTTTRSSGDMALVISLISPNGSYDSMFLKNYAQVYFMDKIKRVYGVGSVTEYTDDFAMRIWLNPEKLASHGLTVTDVTDAPCSIPRASPAPRRFPATTASSASTLKGRRAKAIPPGRPWTRWRKSPKKSRRRDSRSRGRARAANCGTPRARC